MRSPRAAAGVDFEGTLDKPKGVGWERDEGHQIPLNEKTEAALKAWMLP
jgi:hypothetical protein